MFLNQLGNGTSSFGLCAKLDGVLTNPDALLQMRLSQVAHYNLHTLLFGGVELDVRWPLRAF